MGVCSSNDDRSKQYRENQKKKLNIDEQKVNFEMSNNKNINEEHNIK